METALICIIIAFRFTLPIDFIHLLGNNLRNLNKYCNNGVMKLCFSPIDSVLNMFKNSNAAANVLLRQNCIMTDDNNTFQALFIFALRL